MASTEIQFAQRLASNERKIRDKAIKKLKKYLEIRSKSKKRFTEEDFTKIWKGLHYCLWMQDKPLIQEELVEKMTALVHSFANSDQTFLFIKVFFITEIREWPTIDKWRVDKFMMLIRQFFRQSLHYIQNNSWQTSYIENLTHFFQQTFLDPQNTRISHGFRMYFNSIFLDELKKTGLKDLTTEKFCLCLQSYINFITISKQKEVIIDIIKKIFEPLINDSLKIRAQQQQNQLGSEDTTCRLVDDKQVCEWLADQLFTLGRNPACTSWHRNHFYAMVRKIRDSQDRKVSTPKPDYENEEDENASCISETAETFDNVVEELKQQKNMTPRQNAKKKIVKVEDIKLNLVKSAPELLNSTDVDSTQRIEPKVNKNLKRKSSVSKDANIVSASETKCSPSKKKKSTPKIIESPTSTPKQRQTKLKKPKTSSVKKNDRKQNMLSTEYKKVITPMSGMKKKVVFDMKKNTALKFKKGMAVSPHPAYVPTKQPEQGILKSPVSPVPVPRCTNKKPVQLFHPKEISNTNKRNTSPVNVKTRRMTRLGAADFF
ncbi:hypothetical protein SNE40_007459 [Patella caerulea]|uniref:Uncharacterized protein n=1 Tax=Patella caerulea TaxID=87958 RepID=A0AAN8JZ07_PATCE